MMKQQKATQFPADTTSETMFSKINDQQSSWSNAWCAVWESHPETRTNGKSPNGKKNPTTQAPSW